MELTIPELSRIEEKLNQIMKRIEELDVNTIPEWVDLKKAAELKSITYNTLKNRIALQPDSSDVQMIGGKRRWHKSVIQKWLKQTDDDLQYVSPKRKTRKN